jgi:S-adenosylmethionine synthetase
LKPDSPFFRYSRTISRHNKVDRANPEDQRDQGMMFGYTTNETENTLPLALDLS